MFPELLDVFESEADGRKSLVLLQQRAAANELGEDEPIRRQGDAELRFQLNHLRYPITRTNIRSVELEVKKARL